MRRAQNESAGSGTAEKLQEFDIADEVSFEHEGDIITSTVSRVNKKTLSIRTDIGPKIRCKNLGANLN